jgi:hypothetical protein
MTQMIEFLRHAAVVVITKHTEIVNANQHHPTMLINQCVLLPPAAGLAWFQVKHAWPDPWRPTSNCLSEKGDGSEKAFTMPMAPPTLLSPSHPMCPTCCTSVGYPITISCSSSSSSSSSSSPANRLLIPFTSLCTPAVTIPGDAGVDAASPPLPSSDEPLF